MTRCLISTTQKERNESFPELPTFDHTTANMVDVMADQVSLQGLNCKCSHYASAMSTWFSDLRARISKTESNLQF